MMKKAILIMLIYVAVYAVFIMKFKRDKYPAQNVQTELDICSIDECI
jgi:hypothetical protein